MENLTNGVITKFQTLLEKAADADANNETEIVRHELFIYADGFVEDPTFLDIPTLERNRNGLGRRLSC